MNGLLTDQKLKNQITIIIFSEPQNHNIMYLVYKTDNQHSFKSRDIIGVVDEPNNAIDICQQQAKKEGCKISPDDISNLANIQQTQNYEGDGEYVIEEVNINTLL